MKGKDALMMEMTILYIKHDGDRIKFIPTDLFKSSWAFKINARRIMTHNQQLIFFLLEFTSLKLLRMWWQKVMFALWILIYPLLLCVMHTLTFKL